MAKDISLWGANYSDVPGVNLPQTGGGTAYFVDPSPTTATDADVAQGKIYIKANGQQSVGTASGSGTYQDKTHVVPTASSQTVTPDPGFDALSSVQIDPISSDYVGSNIPRRTYNDISVSGANVTVPAGYYASQSGKSVASGTEGTPTATKGTVSNHQVSITPSVTNGAGYITGGSKNGTPVTVTASELESGNKEITQNGDNIDVSGFSTVSVSVSGGSGKNAQVASGVGRATSSTYTAVGPSLTVAQTGTYDVYWCGYRSSTSGTNGSQLYINNTAYGSAQTSFNTGSGLTNTQNVHLSNVSLTQGQVLTIRARSRGNNYYMYVMNLVIVET